MTEFHYKAFISYSWSDQKWSQWLHRALETYHPPKDLIGSKGRHGPVPARLMPLFKDRDEEAAGSSISQAIEEGLAASEFLIVICSPRSARSRWVNHEIAWFKTHRSPAKILALIVDGDPDSSDPSQCCFPAALTHQVTPTQVITGIVEPPPLAADARRIGDGRRQALLKTAAALLGVGLDDLIRRDERRRARLRLLVTGSSTALALIMGILAWTATTARDEAQFQRVEAEGLVEYMLTDLRHKLEPVGRLEVLDGVGERALVYYAAQDIDGMDADSLGRRARAQHLVGEVNDQRGNSKAALAAFAQAAATTEELLGRQPYDSKRVFDHAQSVFWVGYTAWEKGDSRTAEANFRQYRQLADRLVASDPRRAEWMAEVGYAAGNLGILLLEAGRFTEATQQFATALAISERAAAARPTDSERQHQLGEGIAWYADAQYGRGAVREAIVLRERQEALYRAFLQRDPRNARAKDGLYRALGSKAIALNTQGDRAGAARAQAESLALVRDISALDPANVELRGDYLRALAAAVEYGATPPGLEFQRAVTEARKRWRANPRDVRDLATWTRVGLVNARLALAAQQFGAARDAAADVAQSLRGAPDTVLKPATALSLATANLVLAEVEMHQGRQAQAVAAARAAEAVIQSAGKEHDPQAQAALRIAALVHGHDDRATGRVPSLALAALKPFATGGGQKGAILQQAHVN